MSDPNDLGNLMQNITQAAAGMQAMQSISSAYDAFATAAMQVLLEKMDRGEFTNAMFDALAHDAWRIADAMMTERRDRGIGGLPKPGGGDGA